jgi:hypothetical protein
MTIEQTLRRTEPRRGALRALAVALVAALVGCTTTSLIPPRELARLDGYQAADADERGRSLETVEGDKVTFGRSTQLYLKLPDGSPGGRFESIQVRDGVFDGRTTDRRQVRAAMDDIRVAKVEKTDYLGGGIFLGGLALALLVAIALSGGNEMPTAVPGRALRVDGRVVSGPLAPAASAAAAAVGWGHGSGEALGVDTSSLSPAARARLAAAWTDAACAEHASVPAFSRLSLTLMTMGAPAELVEAAHRAAIDEVGHARLAFALAEAYAGAPVAPGPLAELRHAPAVTARSLSELAAESLIDGCLMEGVAAAAAAAAAGSARVLDPVVRDILITIARQEHSHAELAWAIVTWSCEQGGPEVARHLHKTLLRARFASPPFDVPADLEAEVSAHGLLPAAAWRDLYQHTRAGVAERLAITAKLGVRGVVAS